MMMVLSSEINKKVKSSMLKMGCFICSWFDYACQYMALLVDWQKMAGISIGAAVCYWGFPAPTPYDDDDDERRLLQLAANNELTRSDDAACIPLVEKDTVQQKSRYLCYGFCCHLHKQ